MADDNNGTNEEKELREKLEGLIDAKSRSRANREAFSNCFVKLASIRGVDDVVVGYLYEGFDIAGAEPFHRFAKEAGDEDAYNKLFSSQRSAFNKDGETFRVYLNILALELVSPTGSDAIDNIVSRLSGAKPSRRKGVSQADIKKLLLVPIGNDGISEEARVQAGSARSLYRLLKDPLESCQEGRGGKASKANEAKSLIEWLEDQAATTDEVGAASPEDQSDNKSGSGEDDQLRVAPSEPAADRALATDNQRQASTSRKQSSPERKTKAASLNKNELSMDSVIGFLSEYQKEHNSQTKLVERLRSENIEAQSKIADLESSLRRAKQETEDVKELRASLSENYRALQQDYSRLREKDDKLVEELSAAKDMLSMINERDAHEADSSMRSLARELQFDYRNYLDALEIPMDSGLGEVMRDLLGSVFSVIKSHGIDL